MKPVGYLFNRPEGLDGERGSYYNYIFASNGVFVEAENKLLSARIPIGYCDIRGLVPSKMKLSLTYGSIPQRFFDLTLDRFLSDTSREHYIAIVGEAGYHFYVPEQERAGGSVKYERSDNVVVDIHSHGTLGSWFSTQDNSDELGLKVYGVVGYLDTYPVVRIRLGVYGYFLPLAWKEVFDGSLVGATEYEDEKGVIEEDELRSDSLRPAGELSHPGSRLWRDW